MNSDLVSVIISYLSHKDLNRARLISRMYYEGCKNHLKYSDIYIRILYQEKTRAIDFITNNLRCKQTANKIFFEGEYKERTQNGTIGYIFHVLLLDVHEQTQVPFFSHDIDIYIGETPFIATNRHVYAPTVLVIELSTDEHGTSTFNEPLSVNFVQMEGVTTCCLAPNKTTSMVMESIRNLIYSSARKVNFKEILGDNHARFSKYLSTMDTTLPDQKLLLDYFLQSHVNIHRHITDFIKLRYFFTVPSTDRGLFSDSIDPANPTKKHVYEFLSLIGWDHMSVTCQSQFMTKYFRDVYAVSGINVVTLTEDRETEMNDSNKRKVMRHLPEYYYHPLTQTVTERHNTFEFIYALGSRYFEISIYLPRVLGCYDSQVQTNILFHAIRYEMLITCCAFTFCWPYLLYRIYSADNS
jgi:hypothetical protein